MINTAQKIDSFATYQPGWSFREGIPFDKATLIIATAILQQGIEHGFVTNDAFPGLDGEVMVTFYSGDYYHEFIIERTGNISYICEIDRCEVLSIDDLPMENIWDKVNKIFLDKLNESFAKG